MARAAQKRRLDRTDWLNGALDMLVRSGPEALTVTRLAGVLGVTTGSFYWHFENRDAFIAALLEHWLHAQLETAGLEARRTAGDGRIQIDSLGRILASRRLPQLDAAMRDWGSTEARVRAAVRRADRLRSSFLAAFFRSAGIPPEEATQRAELAMGYWIGSATFGDPVATRTRRMQHLIRILVHEAATSRRLQTRPARRRRAGPRV